MHEVFLSLREVEVVYQLDFLPKKGPKMKLFKFFEKSMHGTFLNFLHEVTGHKSLTLTQMIFSGKIWQ